MRAEPAVNKRIEHALAEHRAASEQQRMTFRENARQRSRSSSIA
jgi:hypothetical protein